MLNKKTAFKPKAAIRRPATKPGPQPPSRPSTTEPSANTTPTPQEPSSTSQSQPAPHPAASTVVTEDEAASTTRVRSQEQEKPGDSATVVSGPQTGASLTPPAIETRADEEQPVAAVVEEAPGKQPTAPEVGGQKSQTTLPSEESITSDAQAVAAPTDAPPPTAPPAEEPTNSTTHTLTNDHPAPHAEDQPVQARAAQTEISNGENQQSNTGTASEPAPDAPQAAKPKRGRKRTAAAADNGDAAQQSSAAPSKKRPRRRAAPLPGEEGYQPKSTRSRKRSGPAAANGEAREQGDENTEQDQRRPSRTQREATPPDAEAVEIDITQVKMADLAKDMHIGKKFSLHDELMERERAKRLRYNERRKRQQAGEDGDDAGANDETPNTSSNSNNNPSTSAQPTPVAAAQTADGEDDKSAEPPAENRATIGETYQIIDGEIVLDHRSLQVDRHARAREEAGELVEVEENDFTHHTTSATYLRRSLKPQQWTDDETDLFYQALQAFGTDFDTICRMFKGKTRKHIKLKFNREERVNPARITAALVGQKTVAIDMEQYQRATGQEYEPAQAIYAEQRKAEEEFQARQKALEDEKAEEVRRKKEEVLAQLNTAVNEEGVKKGGRRGRKKKVPAAMGL
ncbi:transcription factor TFIIIB component-like protein [Chaetomium sp. MPI-SDFR-AT-0129]|nr:transcription factor TFIIIB component-like protein [Chaetomium sp. MPI-SDFR-AT-0129]